MKTISGALTTLLNGNRTFNVADLVTIILVDGSTIYRYTSWDADLTVSANLFSSMHFDRGKTRSIVGVEVDTLELTFFCDTNDVIGSQTFIQAANSGTLDGATLKLERCFMATPGDTTAGTVTLFLGRLADMELGRSYVKITANSHLELLNTNMPRNLYAAGCIHTLYDTGCTLSPLAYRVTSSAASGTTAIMLKSALAQADGYFTLGKIKMTSGANTGLWRTVRLHANSGGTLNLVYPLPTVPTVGDTFDAYPGCDRQQTTCTTKYSNLANFRATPFVPVPEVGV